MVPSVFNWGLKPSERPWHSERDLDDSNACIAVDVTKVGTAVAL